MKIKSYYIKRNRPTELAAQVVAGMFVIMLMTQLFGYEDFSTILGVLLPMNDAPTLHVVAAAIVIIELLALPYLLGMYVSKLMYILSGVLAASGAMFWLFTSLTNSHASNSGLFSTTLEVPGGLLAAAWALALFAGMVLIIREDSKLIHPPLEKKSKLE